MWKYFFVIVWIASILASGIHLFSRGFLLSRVTTSQHSTCIRLSDCQTTDDTNCLNGQQADELIRNVNNSLDYCLPKKSKVILLLIDALKYDFGVYNISLTDPKSHENKLPIIHQLRKKYPNRTRLSKFIADPPTTTLQRLKGLTTGSLPTFIDIGSNFDTPEINEDNIIDQIVRNEMSTVFMGDSTWTELFPNRFLREYSFPSFNIYDLDTVDKEINKVLPNELMKNDWDLLIAHFLGVDHCGHRYGPMHKEMGRKLSEMNEMIENVARDMDNDTILFVIGDHGMTGTGDHGGETSDETDALIFSYSKKYNFYEDDQESQKEMRQIDIVPTISTIFGVPIPFSNLGMINFNYLPNIPNKHLTQRQLMLLHSWQNALQIRHYFTNYSRLSIGLFPDDVQSDQDTKFMIYSMRATSLYTDRAKANFHKDLKVYLREMLKLCRDIWVNFDASKMSQGLIIVAVTAVLIFLLIGSLNVVHFERIFTRNRIVWIYCGNIIAATIGYLQPDRFVLNSVEHAIVLLMSIFNISFMGILIAIYWSSVSDSLNKQRHQFDIIPRALFIFSISVFFSNSFIIEEQNILRFMLTGILFLMMNDVRRTNIRWDTKIKFRLRSLFVSNWMQMALGTLFTVCVLRCSTRFFRCREEQGNCTDFKTIVRLFESSHLESFNNRSETEKADIIPVIVLALFATLSKMYLRFIGSQFGFSLHVLTAKYSFVVTALAVGGHFVLSRMPRAGVKQINIDGLAWVAYATLVFHILVVLTKPLMVYIVRDNTADRPHNGTGTIPAVFNYLRKEWKNSDPKDDRALVIGITSVYSSVLISIGVTLTMVLTILLGPVAAMGLFITMTVLVAFLGLGGIIRYQTARQLELCLQPQYLTLISWTLLAQFGFYATSHQPTLSQIDWHAAFVGRSAIYDHSNYLSALMVLLNTFAGPIIVYFLFPLLILLPLSLHAHIPNLVPRLSSTVDRKTKEITFENGRMNIPIVEQDFNFDIWRGELVLYDNEECFIGTVFKVGCQLIMLQGLRVFCSMLACTIHARHLMVWKIFAPKFMYEGISTYLSFIAILLGFVVILRTHAILTRLITKLVKT